MQPVEIYFNSHKKCFSVRQNGYVKGHLTHATLADVEFRVNDRGRDRVRATGRKEVHAVVRGHLVLDPEPDPPAAEGVRVGYNPYRDERFTDRDRGQVVRRADRVRLGPDGIVAWGSS